MKPALLRALICPSDEMTCEQMCSAKSDPPHMLRQCSTRSPSYVCLGPTSAALPAKAIPAMMRRGRTGCWGMNCAHTCTARGGKSTRSGRQAQHGYRDGIRGKSATVSLGGPELQDDVCNTRFTELLLRYTQIKAAKG